MYWDVTEAHYFEGYKLKLTFENVGNLIVKTG